MAKLDTIKLSPNDTSATMYLLAAAARPGFIWGPPGIGKSEVAKEMATRMGKAFIDIRLSQMDPTDVRGMPYKVEEGGVTVGVAWSPPLSFPRDLDEQLQRDIPAVETLIRYNKVNLRGTNGIPYVKKPVVTVQSLTDGLTAELVEPTNIEELRAADPYYGTDQFTVRLVDADGKTQSGRIIYSIRGEAEGVMAFEEMNSAPPSVLAACYQIILDRRCGEYVVPKGVSMFAMGNRDDDRGVAFRMPTPLMNRFVHIEMTHNHEDWMNWAVSNRVNSKVVGFIGASPGLLMKFEPNSASRGFPTPRSWSFVSNILNTVEGGHSLTPVQFLATLSGTVGDAPAAQFNEFIKIAESLPNPHDVLSGKVTKLNVEANNRVALSYHLTTQLLYVLTEEHEALVSEGNAGHQPSDYRKNEKRAAWGKKMNNWLDFSMANFKPEVCVMGITMAMKHYDLPFEQDTLSSFGTFVEKFDKLLGQG